MFVHNTNRLKRLGQFWDRVMQYFVEILDLQTIKICGFADWVPDMRKRKEPKNVRICGLDRLVEYNHSCTNISSIF
jgi:hypothetical protein